MPEYAHITATQIEAFRSQLRGEVLEPSSASYDATRVVWNGMIDRRPALIARCRNAADVAAAISFAKDNGLAIAVRSGGHNVAGYAVCDGGLMLDLSAMNGVRVVPGLDRAIVEGGAMWGDVDAATTAFDRATPGGLISATVLRASPFPAGLAGCVEDMASAATIC